MEQTPRVSIIVPVYNVERYLRQCLDTLVNQTYQNVEIICIDDGSTDASSEILTEYALKNSRVRVIRQKTPDSPQLAMWAFHLQRASMSCM